MAKTARGTKMRARTAKSGVCCAMVEAAPDRFVELLTAWLLRAVLVMGSTTLKTMITKTTSIMPASIRSENIQSTSFTVM